MAHPVTTKINGEKLKREFGKRNISLLEASQTCGFEASYFSKVCRANKITKYAAHLLDHTYNIKYDAYKEDGVKKEEVINKSADEFTITEEVSNALYKIIYSAVYEAVKKAWSE